MPKMARSIPLLRLLVVHCLIYALLLCEFVVFQITSHPVKFDLIDLILDGCYNVWFEQRISFIDYAVLMAYRFIFMVLSFDGTSIYGSPEVYNYMLLHNRFATYA